jgi:hypothetical protein
MFRSSLVHGVFAEGLEGVAGVECLVELFQVRRRLVLPAPWILDPQPLDVLGSLVPEDCWALDVQQLFPFGVGFL